MKIRRHMWEFSWGFVLIATSTDATECANTLLIEYFIAQLVYTTLRICYMIFHENNFFSKRYYFYVVILQNCRNKHPSEVQ